jgi:hypothetical protein
MRYPIYCFEQQSLEKFLNAKQWILRNPELEKKLEDVKFSIVYHDKIISANLAGVRGTKTPVYFEFSQMEGNCNGLFLSMLHGTGTVENRINPDVDPELNTFVMRNVMSYLGCNVAMGSHYDNILPKFEPFGWRIHFTMPSSRGYKHPISYGSLTLDKDEIATPGFGTLSNLAKVKASQEKKLAVVPA